VLVLADIALVQFDQCAVPFGLTLSAEAASPVVY